MVRFALLFIALVTSSPCWAQSPLSVDQHFYERRHKFKQVVQTGANEFTVVQGRREWFFYSSRIFLSRHNLTDGSLVEKRVVLTAHNQPAYLVHTLARDGALFFVCLSPFANRHAMGWSVFRYDLNDGKLDNVIEPQPQNAVPFNAMLNGYMSVARSSDSTKVAVCYAYTENANAHETIYALTLDIADPNLFTTAKLEAHDPITQYERLKFLVDANGQLYALGKQFLNGNNEVTKGKANYAYVLMRATDGTFKTQCTIPDNGTILRSFDATIVGDTLFGSGLASDSTLALNDSLVMLQMNWRDNKTLNRKVTALQNPPPLNAVFANRFENNIFRFGSQTVSAFELQHIAINESARADHGFMYQRGIGIVAVINPDGVATIANVDKWQQFLSLPETSMIVFRQSGSLLATFIDYSDNDNHNSYLSIVNLASGRKTTYSLPFEEWEKNSTYEMFVSARGVVALQSDSRKYRYIIAPMP